MDCFNFCNLRIARNFIEMLNCGRMLVGVSTRSDIYLLDRYDADLFLCTLLSNLLYSVWQCNGRIIARVPDRLLRC